MFSRVWNPKKVFCRGPVCLPGWLKTLGKPSISLQTCAQRLESCITIRYMIPSGRRKFELETEVIWLFRCTLGGQNLRGTSIMLQTRADRLESSITMWYMIPSDPRKFEPETELIMTFWYFEDVISKWPKSLKHSIPLTKILRPQSRSPCDRWIQVILTFWYFEDVIPKWPKSLKYSKLLTKMLRPRWPKPSGNFDNASNLVGVKMTKHFFSSSPDHGV